MSIIKDPASKDSTNLGANYMAILTSKRIGKAHQEGVFQQHAQTNTASTPSRRPWTTLERSNIARHARHSKANPKPFTSHNLHKLHAAKLHGCLAAQAVLAVVHRA
jgi:hypothetical protein